MYIYFKDTISSGKIQIFVRTFIETFVKFWFQNRNSKPKNCTMWDLKQKLINWRFKVAENIYIYILIDKKYLKI